MQEQVLDELRVDQEAILVEAVGVSEELKDLDIAREEKYERINQLEKALTEIDLLLLGGKEETEFHDRFQKAVELLNRIQEMHQG